MRLAVYSDYSYSLAGDELRAEVAFALFVEKVGRRLERLTLVGRLTHDATRTPYRCGHGADLRPLPYYESLANPLSVIRAARASLAAFWRLLDEVDAVWLMGPHPLATAFALLARVRRRGVVLGVRQHMPSYVATRRPGRPALRLAAWVLEGAFRALAWRCPVIAVGPELAADYQRSPRLLEIVVSLVEEEEIVSIAEATGKRYDGELVAVSVGRLDPEKNPLLLADILAELNTGQRPWRLVVCGDGSMAADLERRIAELGVADRAELRGNVPNGPELHEVYRSGHALLHVSWTEGLPQVLVEAFAAGLPVVATDVGGVGPAVGEAVRLVPPGDARAAVTALDELSADPELRLRLVSAGHAFAAAHTASLEADRVAEFLQAA